MIALNGRHKSLPQLLTGFVLLATFNVQAFELSDMISDSISAHPEVKEKIHIYRQLLSDKAIANSGWRPSVDLQASTGLYDTTSPFTGNNSVDYDSSRIELSVTQNLFNGYDTTHQVKQTEARIRAALYDIYDTADNIALRAVQAYLELIKQRQLYQLALDNLASHEHILAQIQERNDSGVGRRSQLQQTEGRVARAHASLIAQQNNLEDAATQLHQVLGRYLDPEDLIIPQLPQSPAESLDELIDSALKQHPAMQVAEGNIEASQADHRRSLGSRYPEIDLRLATEYGDDIGGIPGSTEETSLVLNLRYNLYSGGRDSAEQQQKISAIYEQQDFLARVRRQIINSLRLSWMADTSLTRQLEFLQLHITKASETVESYREEFFIGQRDLVDLLDAENELNSARNLYSEASMDAYIARYRVYEGMGQLFQASNIDLQFSDGSLKIARLDTSLSDSLPLPDDEDEDNKIDRMDHCDNSRSMVEVNQLGCMPKVRREVVAVKANSAPVASDDRFEIETNGILVISTSQLLENDTDADADPLKVVEVEPARFGRLAFNHDDNIVYRPAEGFVGVDSFSYSISDSRGGASKAAAIVQINVKVEEITLDKMQLVNFIYDETELTEISKSKVIAIIEKIRQASDINIEIFTYTDDIGSDGFNLELSERRAEALKTLLISHGINATDISARGMGEKNPIADNSTEAGQAINRRGEFKFNAKSSIQ